MHFSQSYVCYAMSTCDSPGKSCSFDRNSGLEGYFRDSGFDQNTVRDSGKRELYHILTDKGTLQIPGKRDSPKFKRGMRDFFYLNVGNSGERTFERQKRITQQRVECALLDFFMLLFLVTREEFGIFAGKGAVMRDQGPLQIDYLHK